MQWQGNAKSIPIISETSHLKQFYNPNLNDIILHLLHSFK